jgi:hypothetical protein
MELGFIKLYRKFQHNDMWREPRMFSRAEAWIDLLFMAAYRDHDKLLNGALHEVKRGQIVTTSRELADRWQWSRAKVDNFLKSHKKSRNIDILKTAKKTTLTIVKYELYNGDEATEKPQNDHKKTAEKAALSNDKKKVFKKKGGERARTREETDAPADVSDPKNQRPKTSPFYYPHTPEHQTAIQVLKSFSEITGRQTSRMSLKVVIDRICEGATYDELVHALKVMSKKDYYRDNPHRLTPENIYGEPKYLTEAINLPEDYYETASTNTPEKEPSGYVLPDGRRVTLSEYREYRIREREKQQENAVDVGADTTAIE